MNPLFLVRTIIESVEINNDLINQLREHFPQDWTNEEFVQHIHDNITDTELMHLIEDIGNWEIDDVEYDLVKQVINEE